MIRTQLWRTTKTQPAHKTYNYTKQRSIKETQMSFYRQIYFRLYLYLSGWKTTWSVKNMSVSRARKEFFIYSLKQQTNKQKQEEINSSRVYCYNDRGHLRANAKQINVEMSLIHLLSLWMDEQRSKIKNIHFYGNEISHIFFLHKLRDCFLLRFVKRAMTRHNLQGIYYYFMTLITNLNAKEKHSQKVMRVTN